MLGLQKTKLSVKFQYPMTPKGHQKPKLLIYTEACFPVNKSSRFRIIML